MALLFIVGILLSGGGIAPAIAPFPTPGIKRRAPPRSAQDVDGEPAAAGSVQASRGANCGGRMRVLNNRSMHRYEAPHERTAGADPGLRNVRAWRQGAELRDCMWRVKEG
ncbi:MAG TPA: hypothetical protein PJ986_15175 [Gammaproteobacteria bacterium]|nr:hypothetical protein [Gammaproteobacteria bacterium]